MKVVAEIFFALISVFQNVTCKHTTNNNKKVKDKVTLKEKSKNGKIKDCASKIGAPFVDGMESLPMMYVFVNFCWAMTDKQIH